MQGVVVVGVEWSGMEWNGVGCSVVVVVVESATEPSHFTDF